MEEKQLPIETKNLDDIKSNSAQLFKIKPRILDNVIGPILLSNQISVIHGTERFPLTAIAHAIVIGGARSGFTAVYFDSGSNFSPQLARTLADNDNCLLDRVMVGEIYNLRNLQEFVDQIKALENISVIIIDCLTGVLNLSSPPGSKSRQRELFATLEVLRELVIETNIHIMITDHTTKHWKTGESRPIGGNVIEHAVDSIINVQALDEIDEGFRIQIERCTLTPNPGGVIVRIGHRGIRSLKSL